METDNKEDNNMNLVMDLDEATEMEDEVQITVEAINLDEVLCARLLKFYSPEVHVSITVIASTCMDRIILLKKMGRKRLKENPTDDNDCYTHQCKHCNALLSFP